MTTTARPRTAAAPERTAPEAAPEAATEAAAEETGAEETGTVAGPPRTVSPAGRRSA
ncbi:hypothetical protein GCM10018980_39810 [Streptomyces capoamus]|uniref:Uncharacterized protein n=1 Tax=Streptomyces capoamus TaxID=68183 RepID=A0A919EWP6_9ACTN|nr:hypothetical protein [Streptomyces capoamus]GGW15221.1 hypothetical protein GCM10010501_26380 [Streptomyces libani subsp. rufus]GHG54849.1 hypothetical protein GCM10018980_39810 [Streptomyces capoamus]